MQRYLFLSLLALLAFLVVTPVCVNAQTYTMSAAAINSCTGTHLDPGGAGNYGNNANVTQTITSSTAGQQVVLTFTAFNTEATFDFLYIYDGPNTSSPLLGKYHGTVLPGVGGVVYSNNASGALTLRFTSDAGTVAAGWSATISCTATVPIVNATCPAAITSTDYGGALGNYINNLDYTQTYMPSGGNWLQIAFTTFATESGFDYLYLYDGPNTSSPLIGTYSGATSPGTKLATNTGALTLRFTSDGGTVAAGWSALITCVTPTAPSCPALSAPANGATGITFTGTTLSWTASANTSSYKLYFGTDAAATNINNGTNIGNVTSYNLTGLNPSTTYYWKIVSTNSAGDATGCTIRSFTTNNTANISTTAISLSCPASFTYYDGGGSGGNYANSQDVTQTFTASAGQQVMMNFSSFATEATFDFLYIYDGPNTSSPLLGKFHGNVLPGVGGVIYSNNASRALTVRFTSDGGTVAAGWAATVSCTTAPVVNVSCPTTVVSTDYGGAGNYINNLDYTQTYTPSAGNWLQIAFTAFNTESGFDYLYIYNGANTSAPLLGTYSGTTSPGTILATNTGQITLRFTSDGGTVAAGWSANITCVTAAVPSCPSLSSPANAATGVSSSGTSLTWSAAALASSYKLYFGTDAAATNINNGTNIGNVTSYATGALSSNTTYYWKIVSTNSIGDATGCTIRSFTTDNIINMSGTNQSVTCPSTITYRDPGGTGNYADGLSVTQTFTPSAGNWLQIAFSAFSTEATFDFLYIYDGPNTSSPQVAGSPFSGTTLPGTFLLTNTGQVTLRFTSDSNTNSSGWTASITCVAVTAPSCPALSAPANGATGIASSGTTLSWSAATYASSYKLYFGTDAAATNIVNGTNIGNVTSYATGGLSLNTTYYWKIVATNSSGDATGCTIRSFTTNSAADMSNTSLGITCPATITYRDPGGAGNYGDSQDFTQTFTPSAGNWLQVSFSAFNTESGYDYLYIYDGPNTTYPQVAGSPFNGTTVPGTFLLSNTGQVTFVFHSDVNTNASGWTASITCVPATVPGCAAAPTAPTNGAVNQVPAALTLSWPSVTYATGYRLTLGDNAPTYDNIANNVDLGNVTSYVTGALNSAANYRWKIVPYNTAGPATGCAQWQFTTGNGVTMTTTTITTCSTFLFDPGGGGGTTACSGAGGATGDYANNLGIWMRINPSVAGNLVSITFNDFCTEANQDTLTIYDGVTGPATEIGRYHGSLGVFTVTSTNGSLWLRFRSNGSNRMRGFVGVVSCIDPSTTNGTCATARVIPTAVYTSAAPYVLTGQNTNTAINSVTNTTLGACSAVADNLNGYDYMFKYYSPINQCVTVELRNLAASGDVSVGVFQNCPNSAGSQCIGTFGKFAGAAGGNGTFSLSADETYYFVVATDGAPVSSAFDFRLYGAFTYTADLPCDAIRIDLGTAVMGDNSCATNFGEPATPACWVSSVDKDNTISSYTSTLGSLNTVWYQVTAASNNLKIRITPGTMIDPQMAVYSGTCSSLSLLACNDDGANNCGSVTGPIGSTAITVLESYLDLAVTAGQTYFIRVDGRVIGGSSSERGTFFIKAYDNTNILDPETGQDCSNSIQICNSVTRVGNPGFFGGGSTCDLDGLGSTATCLDDAMGVGELNVLWYYFNVANTGTVRFTITPNFSGTDYDWLLYKVPTGGSTVLDICGQLNNKSLIVKANSIACGSGTCATGVGGGSSSCITNSYGSGGQFTSDLAATAGDIYLLGISNYDVTQASGFILDFSGSGAGVVNYGTPNGVTWTGGAGTSDWNNADNWGGCVVPSCTVDAVLFPGPIQPVIKSTDNAQCRNLKISPGGYLTINPSAQLNICQNILNQSAMNALPTSTVRFTSTNAGTVTGNLTGINSFANVIVDKGAGVGSTLTLNDPIQCAENLTLTNGSMIANGKNVAVEGDMLITANGRFNGSNSSTRLYLAGNYTNNGYFVANQCSTLAVGVGNNQGLNGFMTGVNAFYDLTVAKPSGLTVNMNAAVDVSRDLLIQSGGTYNTNSNYLKVGRNYTNSGTFTAGTGTVEWYGTGLQTLAGTMTGTSRFNNILVNNTGGAIVDQTANAQVNNITLQRGNYRTNANTLFVSGNITNNNATDANKFTAGTGIVEMNGTTTQNIGGTQTFVSPNNFYNLHSNNNSTNRIELNVNADVANNFNIADGHFDDNASYLKVGGNFINADEFIPGTGTVEFNGAAASQQQFNKTGIGNFYNLTMNNTNAGLLLLNNNAIVANQLTLTNGVIQTTNSYEVSVTNSAPTASTTGNVNSYIFGRMRRAIQAAGGGYDFPVGDVKTGKGYQRAWINLAATGVTELFGFFNVGAPSGAVKGVTECGTTAPYDTWLNNGYWTINVTAGTSPWNYDVKLYNRNYTNGGGSVAYTNQKRPDAAGAWDVSGTCDGFTLSGGALIVSRLGSSGFSDHATAFSPTPFPVEMLSLQAKPLVSSINLEWMTATETNNSGFEVYRTLDPSNESSWKKIGWVNGAGTTTEARPYALEDKEVNFNTVYYYRLRQIDFNGSFHLSNVVSASLVQGDQSLVSFYPNPVRDELTVSINTAQKDRFTFKLFNTLGQTVWESEQTFESGQYFVPVPFARLAPGQYQMVVTSKNGSKVEKIIKTN